MKFCPNCNHKLYEGTDGTSFCKNCPFVNKPMKTLELEEEIKDSKLLEKTHG